MPGWWCCRRLAISSRCSSPAGPCHSPASGRDRWSAPCIEDQVYAAAWSDWSAGRRRFTPVGAPGLVRGAVEGPSGIDLLTDRGIFRWAPGTTGCRLVELPAGELAGPSVMALAAGGRSVWLGYFDGGIEARDGAESRGATAWRRRR